MTQKNAEFLIDNGPSKLALMLSLFDTDMGARMVTFHTDELVPAYDACEFNVQIVSARRRNSTATIWEIEGLVETSKDSKKENVRVSIYYHSATRQGRVRFEEKLLTRGILETPGDSKRVRALMIVIEKMIATYQNSHRDKLDEEIFKLFENAKQIKRAENRDSLIKAIENL